MDASFLLALLPGEADGAVMIEAYPRLRRKLEFVAPHLALLETGNVIHGRRRSQFGASLRERRSLHRTLLEGVAFVSDEDRERLEAAAALAEEHGLSLYDALYLALAAKTPEAVLLSQDRRLLAAARAALGPARAFSAREAAAAFGDPDGPRPD